MTRLGIHRDPSTPRQLPRTEPLDQYTRRRERRDATPLIEIHHAPACLPQRGAFAAGLIDRYTRGVFVLQRARQDPGFRRGPVELGDQQRVGGFVALPGAFFAAIRVFIANIESFIFRSDREPGFGCTLEFLFDFGGSTQRGLPDQPYAFAFRGLFTKPVDHAFFIPIHPQHPSRVHRDTRNIFKFKFFFLDLELFPFMDHRPHRRAVLIHNIPFPHTRFLFFRTHHIHITTRRIRATHRVIDRYRPRRPHTKLRHIFKTPTPTRPKHLNSFPASIHHIHHSLFYRNRYH